MTVSRIGHFCRPKLVLDAPGMLHLEISSSWSLPDSIFDPREVHFGAPRTSFGTSRSVQGPSWSVQDPSWSVEDPSISVQDPSWSVQDPSWSVQDLSLSVHDVSGTPSKLYFQAPALLPPPSPRPSLECPRPLLECHTLHCPNL